MPVKFCLVILLLTLFQDVGPAQGIVWPEHVHSRWGRPPIKEGFIVLAKGDTLKGWIMVLAGNPDAYPIVVTGTKNVQRVALPYIASMRIYHDKPGGPYVDYINLPHTWFLWRLDGKKKDVAIYDDVFRGGNLNHMILVTPMSRMRLYKGPDWTYSTRINSVLISFINERYKTGMKVADFKTTKEIIDYILDKESSRFENSGP